MLLIGAAPNAIAYDSNQFATGELFVYGLYASIILMAVLAVAVNFLRPMMGVPVKLQTCPSTNGIFRHRSALPFNRNFRQWVNAHSLITFFAPAKSHLAESAPKLLHSVKLLDRNPESG